MRKVNYKFKLRNPIMGVVVGVFIALLLSLFFVLLSPIFIINEYWKSGAENYIIPIFQAVALLLGACFAGFVVDKQLLLATVSVGVVYILNLLAIAIITFGGVTMQFLFTFIACLISQICAIYLVMKPKKSLIHKSRRAANC